MRREDLLMPTIEGAYGMAVISVLPVAGTDEVQSSIISGGPPTTLTFQLVVGGFTTAPITWNSTNATLLTAINNAIAALPGIGAANIVASAGTTPALTAGIGQVLYTFSGLNFGKKVQPLITVGAVVQTGTATTIGAFTRATPGVDATMRGHLGVIFSTFDKKVYANMGTPQAPTWTVVGTQA
jgi:hypothetical protein